MGKLKQFFARLLGYSAARWSADRSRVSAPLQDARRDFSTRDRKTLVALSRYWERENGYYQKVADLWEQYVAGPTGLQVNSASVDQEWNSIADFEFEQWSRFPDLQSLQSFGVLTGLIARTWFVDGEVFIRKTVGDSGRPRLQLFESHEIETPDDLSDQEGLTIVDGIAIDSNRRPSGYWVKSVDGSVLIPAAQMLHVYEPHRVRQYRGIPIVTSVLNDLHDLADLQHFEMIAAKEAATISNIVMKRSGEHSRSGLTRQRFSLGQTSATGSTVNEATVDHVRSALPGRTIAVGIDEDVKQFVSNRPSVAAQQFWEYLIQKFCAGTGITKLLVQPSSMQGTVVRADLDIQDAFFRARSAVLQQFVADVREYVIQGQLRFSPRLRDLPPDWRSVSVHPPRSVKVDIGYDSQAAIAEIHAGLRTRQDFFGERGQNWRKQLRQAAIEAAEIKALATEYGIEPSEIDQHLTNAQATDLQPSRAS